MKRWKKLLVSLLTVSMTIGASTMSVMAANGYTYKVTLSAVSYTHLDVYKRQYEGTIKNGQNP